MFIDAIEYEKITFILVCCNLMLFEQGFGQSFIRNSEIEVGPSVVVSGASLNGKFEPTWNLFVEARYNFSQLPFDVGIRFGLGSLSRRWDATGADAVYHFKNLLAVVDYNFRRGKNVSIFVGAGLGWSHHKDDFYPLSGATTTYGDSFCCMPRAGVELFRVVRLSVGWNLMEREYRNVECSLGIVIGGWRRR